MSFFPASPLKITATTTEMYNKEISFTLDNSSLPHKLEDLDDAMQEEINTGNRWERYSLHMAESGMGIE